MLMLTWPAAPGRTPGVVLVFGTGLVGGAVAGALARATGAAAQRWPWRWPDAGARDAPGLERAAIAALGAHPDAELSVVWAAGRSGFGSDTEAMADEAAALKAVLASGRRILSAVPDRQGALHHVSSAGGLFEGQTACAPGAAPRPLRPYGAGKLVQERMVASATGFARRRIHRPSSVYGHAPGARRGLIPALISAGLRRVPARIVGTMTTQRDYVHADDVGRYVAAAVLDPGPAPVATTLLAQGRPTSIFEILRMVEAQIGLTILRALDPRPDNARDTTFLRTAVAPGFRPMPLSEGIARTALALRQDRSGAAS